MLELEMPDLLGEPGLPVLTISSPSCDGCQLLAADFDDFPHGLRGNVVTHGCSGVDCHEDAALEDKGESGGS